MTIETLEITHPDLLICDCAKCKKVLIGESDLTRISGMEHVYHRRNTRPYCATCADKWARATISLADRAKEIAAGAMAKYEAAKQMKRGA